MEEEYDYVDCTNNEYKIEKGFRENLVLSQGNFFLSRRSFSSRNHFFDYLRASVQVFLFNSLLEILSLFDFVFLWGFVVGLAFLRKSWGLVEGE